MLVIKKQIYQKKIEKYHNHPIINIYIEFILKKKSKIYFKVKTIFILFYVGIF
jgi:hypothetical protein